VAESYAASLRSETECSEMSKLIEERDVGFPGRIEPTACRLTAECFGEIYFVNLHDSAVQPRTPVRLRCSICPAGRELILCISEHLYFDSTCYYFWLI
jgi:hypothetical protein